MFNDIWPYKWIALYLCIITIHGLSLSMALCLWAVYLAHILSDRVDLPAEVPGLIGRAQPHILVQWGQPPWHASVCIPQHFKSVVDLAFKHA